LKTLLNSPSNSGFTQAMTLEKHQELRDRTKAFALRIIRMSQRMPRHREANVIANQIAVSYRHRSKLQSSETSAFKS
jgi:hypothetical protein